MANHIRDKQEIHGLGKYPTGIKGLDEITEGGLPRGGPTLIGGAAGCGKTLLMTTEKKRKIAKVLSMVVIIAGFMVIIGWIFDIGFLKSITPSWISMKLATAFAFILSGITLYFIIKAMEGEFDKAQVVLSITSLSIILLMGLLFFSTLFKVHTGAEDLFIKDAPDAVMSVVPGRPSIPTMINFMLIGTAGILTILNPVKFRLKLKITGLIVGAIGAIAIFGYIIGTPLLYYYIVEINSAIALHTAVLFVLLGLGLLCL